MELLQCNATLKTVSQKLMTKRYILQRTSVLCEIVKKKTVYLLVPLDKPKGLCVKVK
jgi:hypothetical protein